VINARVVTGAVAVFVPVADPGIPSPFTGYTTNVYAVFAASPVYTVLMLLAVLMSVPEAGDPVAPPEYVRYILLNVPVHTSVVPLEVIAENVGAFACAHV
jgi:hypothetical protein